MTHNEIQDLINRSLFATLGYLDSEDQIRLCRVFCTWHKGLGYHLISTNTSSAHVKALLKNSKASLYFSDDETFEGVNFIGKVIIHFEREWKELLWHDQDKIYYPKGIDDEDYCVLEFVADSARFYRYDGKGNFTKEEMEANDKDKKYEDKYNHLVNSNI